MSIDTVLEFLNSHGLWFIFLFVFLEYMNAPLMPLAVVFPAIGAWTSYSNFNFFTVNIICVLAALTASAVSYFVGYKGGVPFVNWLRRKFKAFNTFYDKYEPKMVENEGKIMFIGRFLPTVRTLIGYLAGILKVDFKAYMLQSIYGIVVINFVYMAAGLGFFEFLL